MGNREDLIRKFITELPFCRALALEMVNVGAGWAELVLPWNDALVGDTETGVVHGGAVSALIDTACGAATVSHPHGGGQTATLDLRIDYMRPASPGQSIIARAECYHMTRSIAFVRALAHDEDRERMVAHASAAFTLDGTTP